MTLIVFLIAISISSVLYPQTSTPWGLTTYESSALVALVCAVIWSITSTYNEIRWIAALLVAKFVIINLIWRYSDSYIANIFYNSVIDMAIFALLFWLSKTVVGTIIGVLIGFNLLLATFELGGVLMVREAVFFGPYYPDISSLITILIFISLGFSSGDSGYLIKRWLSLPAKEFRHEHVYGGSTRIGARTIYISNGWRWHYGCNQNYA